MPTLIASSLIVQFRDATATICIRSLETWTLLPALPIGIQELKTLVQRCSIHRELRKRDCGCQRDVGKSRPLAPQQPFPSVRKMIVDQSSMGQRFLAAMLAPSFVLRQLEFKTETGMQNMEGRDDAI